MATVPDLPNTCSLASQMTADLDENMPLQSALSAAAEAPAQVSAPTAEPFPWKDSQATTSVNKSSDDEEDSDVLPPIPPRESVSAVEALGPDRTVIQYVVYRTPRFATPSGSQDEDEEQLLQRMKDSKAVRCSAHFSLQAANSQAAAHQDRLCKGVVGKSWTMIRPLHASLTTTTTATATTSSTPSASLPPPTQTQTQTQTQSQNPPTPQDGDGPLLYSGRVTFANNTTQLFWVGTETRDLAAGAVAPVAARDMARAGGFSNLNLRVDRAGVALGDAGEENGEGDEDGDEEVGNGEDSVSGNGDAKRVEAVEGAGDDTTGDNGDKNQTEPALEKAAISPSTPPEPNNQNPEHDTTQEKHKQRNDPDDESDSETDNEPDNTSPTTPTPNPPPTPLPPHTTTTTTPLDHLTTRTTLHTTHTTLPAANRAALSTFLALARPANSAIEDHHHYRYAVEPEMAARFAEAGMGDADCVSPAELEWDPPWESRIGGGL
ncbi:hypothetical protein B0I37DRAFT_444065 [Chaetomium sp. MPI-CAGE-AT-0009]|nr:hypothetical protein B0I37DRAFT_444065 [Chaetomium sp. MPI-CAGE-AT-0009]